MGRIEVRVIPRASRDEVVGMNDAGQLRVRLTAPPVEGAANQALIKLLAGQLGVARGTIRIVRGSASRSKVVEVEDVADDELQSRLGVNR